MILYLVSFAILGLLLGSFANVCIHRLPRNESIAFPSSHCPQCGHPIKWYDNIPIFSFLFLRGKCRNCKTSVSVQYPAVEALTSLLIVLVSYRFFYEPFLLIFYIPFVLLLIIIFVIDLHHKIIPDGLNLLILVCGISLSIFHETSANPVLLRVVYSLLSGLACGLMVFCIGYISSLVLKKEALGGGDVKLIGALGALLGIQNTLIALFAGSLIGSIAGIFLILLKKQTRQDYIPFGPFLTAGAYIVLFLPSGFSLW